MMETILSNLRILLPIAAFFWALLLLSVWRKPQRFRNSLLLMVTLGVTMLLVAGLFGDYMGTALLVMFLLCMAALFSVPVLLVVNGVQMLRREGNSPANILSLLLGIVVGVGEIATVESVLIITWEGEEISRMSGLTSFVGATAFYFCFLILAFVLYTLFIQFMPYSRKFDYVVIHGCGLLRGKEVSKLLADRLDRAIAIYHHCGDRPILMPSGGQGDDEDIPEAEAMADYLLSHGIPAEKILKEDRSATTMENILYSKRIIEARSGSHKTALVSSNYHVYRCISYAGEIGWKCTGVGAHVAWYYWPSALIREFVAIFSKGRYLIWILAGYLLIIGIPTLTIWKSI